MRNTFINTLTKIASKNKKIVLIVGDLGFSVVEEFANKFPNRFYNAGVAEQNMTTMAAGLASEGFKVFTYSIANFPTFFAAIVETLFVVTNPLSSIQKPAAIKATKTPPR